VPRCCGGDIRQLADAGQAAPGPLGAQARRIRSWPGLGPLKGALKSSGTRLGNVSAIRLMSPSGYCRRLAVATPALRKGNFDENADCDGPT
jgi:hypothetical protein